MVEMMKKDISHRWWFDSHNSSKRSPWLHTTLSDLENKTKAMLKLIEEDADSFAQRAEMYYQKRPELISMVEDYYRTHRSLAERYDQLKSDVGNRMITSLGSPFSTKSRFEKLSSVNDRNFDSQSETYDHEDCAESEVDDPEHEDEAQIDEDMGEVDGPEEKTEQQVDENAREVQSAPSVMDGEMARLKEEIERLKEENMVQKDQLLQKDDEKREVIRQLTLAMEVLKLENVSLRKFAAAMEFPKKRSRFQFEKLKDVFLGKICNGSPNSQDRMVAL